MVIILGRRGFFGSPVYRPRGRRCLHPLPRSLSWSCLLFLLYVSIASCEPTDGNVLEFKLESRKKKNNNNGLMIKQLVLRSHFGIIRAPMQGRDRNGPKECAMRPVSHGILTSYSKTFKKCSQHQVYVIASYIFMRTYHVNGITITKGAVT